MTYVKLMKLQIQAAADAEETSVDPASFDKKLRKLHESETKLLNTEKAAKTANQGFIKAKKDAKEATELANKTLKAIQKAESNLANTVNNMADIFITIDDLRQSSL